MGMFMVEIGINMEFSIIIFISMSLGYLIAELLHRRMKKKMKREQLICEFIDKQYWQFISLKEWLDKNL